MIRMAQRIGRWMHGDGGAVVGGGRTPLAPVQFFSDDRTVHLLALTLGIFDLWGMWIWFSTFSLPEFCCLAQIACTAPSSPSKGLFILPPPPLENDLASVEFWQKYNLVWLCQFLHYQPTVSSLPCPTGNNHCSVGTWAIWQNTKHSELGMLIAALHAYYVLVKIMWRDIPVEVLYSNVCSVLHRTPLLSPNPGKQRWLHRRRTSSNSEPGSSTGITAFTKTTSRDTRDWTSQEGWHCWWWETATGLVQVDIRFTKYLGNQAPIRWTWE